MSGQDAPLGADRAASGSDRAGDRRPDDESGAGTESGAAADAEVVDAELVAAETEIELDPMTVLTAERDDYLDRLRHLQADFENYRKRVTKQNEDQAARATEGLVERLLPVLDTADLALAHGGGEDVKQIWAALFDALQREGLERLDPAGAPFDPNQHDAVAHEPGEGGQEVAEVLRAGYRWKGRVLRPAMVKVRG